ncbi:cupin domain-containing protein [Candidatus Woesearchaeota archaeon]|nr:cupin domain-containing protein [Candidatus Woesearchaeota archaeon]
MQPQLINVRDLPPVENVCNQILREVISLPKVSMAHVTMKPDDVSLWHQHSRMTEIYLILDGEGILYHGNKALHAEKGAYLVIPPNTPHKLRNTGNYALEHLVFAIPPFDPEDVEIVHGSPGDSAPERFSHDTPPVKALDGALVYELMSAEERRQLDVALAVGFLPPNREATPHLHRISDEVYYVIDGFGKARTGQHNFEVKKDSVIYVPKGHVHALESGSEGLSILCVSSPAYTEEDFILKNFSSGI